MFCHQVPSKTDCVMCFGPVVQNGYGVCYNPMNDHINFALSSFNTCKETNSAHLAQAVESALLDMRALLEQTPRAKLWSSSLKSCDLTASIDRPGRACDTPALCRWGLCTLNQAAASSVQSLVLLRTNSVQTEMSRLFNTNHATGC